MNMEFEENITKRGRKKRTLTEKAIKPVEIPKTPSRGVSMHSEYPRTPVHNIKCDAEYTPRRSARKSIKPAQDYEEIVIGCSLRSAQKEALLKDENTEERKWTPAKVGRVSQKRASRKSNRKSKKSKNDDEIDEVNEESDVKNAINEGKVVEISDEGNGSKAVISLNMQTEDLINITLVKSVEEVQPRIKTKAQTEFSELVLAPLMYEPDTEKEVSEKEADVSANSREEAVSTENNEKDISFVIIAHSEVNNGDVEINETIEFCSKEAFPICQPPSEKSNQVGASPPINSDQKIVKLSQKSNNATGLSPSILAPQEKTVDDEMDDMPSLILCDDDNNEDFRSDKEDVKNDTFNANDCVVISPTDTIVANKKLPMSEFPVVDQIYIDSPLADARKKAKDIQTKYFNSIKCTNQSVPRIIIECVDDKEKPTTSKACNTSRSIAYMASHTPTSAAKRIIGREVTPHAKNSKRGYKFNTPCKDKIDFGIFKTGKENTLASNTSKVSGVTTLEPREIVLRSIRKRSLSTTDCDRYKRKALNVTFYSPANQTATTEDLDQLMAKGVSKTDLQVKNKTKIPRRKRSISLDDNALRFRSKLPRRVKTPEKMPKSPIHPTSRTKIPNFAAIHEKQYKRMENIVDYVARKAERAQNLTNSALKAQRGLSSKLPKNEKPQTAKALPLAINSIKKDNFDKLATRHERHIAMFKGRENQTTERKLKNSEYIKGVRSNRHFELLMQHRKTSGN